MHLTWKNFVKFQHLPKCYKIIPRAFFPNSILRGCIHTVRAHKNLGARFLSEKIPAHYKERAPYIHRCSSYWTEIRSWRTF